MRRTIKNFEDYSIDENGVVYDINDNIVKTFINPCNYVCVDLNGYKQTVAYIMAKTWLKNDKNDLLVGYKDGNYNNLNVDNLYWYFKEPEKIEKTILMVNMEGEIVDSFEDGEEAAKELNLKLSTIFFKCGFWNNNRTLTDGCFLFFEEDFNEELLNKRIKILNDIEEEKKRKREAIKEKKYKKAQSYKKYSEYQVRQPKTKAKNIIEFNSNGDIVNEYEGFYKCLDLLKISYPKLKRIMEVTFTYNGNYFLYKKDFERIENIKLFIDKVEELKTEKEEQKQLSKQIRKEIKPKKQRTLTEEQKQRKEVRQKLQEEKQKRIEDNNIMQFDYNGNLLNTYKNYRQASLYLDITDITIKAIVTGKAQQRIDYFLIYKKDYNEETIKEKINKAKENKKEDSSIMCFDYNGKLIKVYNTAVETSEELNTTDVTIQMICKGKLKQRKECYLIYSKDYDEETILDKINNADKVIDKRVVKIDGNGEVKIYNSAVAAAKELGFTQTTISNICYGKMKQRDDYKLMFAEYYKP